MFEFGVARFVELMRFASNQCVEHVFQHGQFPSAAMKKVGRPKKTFESLGLSDFRPDAALSTSLNSLLLGVDLARGRLMKDWMTDVYRCT